MRGKVSSKVPPPQTPGFKIFLSCLDATVVPHLIDMRPEITSVQNLMGVKAGGFFWSPKIEETAENWARELQNPELAERLAKESLQKVNRILALFKLPSLKEGDDAKESIFKINNYFDEKHNRDNIRELITAKLGEQAPGEQLSFEKFNAVMIELLCAFSGEEKPDKLKLLIEYGTRIKNLNDNTRKQIYSLFNNSSPDRDTWVNCIAIQLYGSAAIFAKQVLSSYGDESERLSHFLMSQLLIGSKTFTAEKYAHLKSLVRAALDDKNFLGAARMISQQVNRKAATGDAFVSGLTHDCLTFAFGAGGCFQSDYFTGQVLEQFVAPLVPQIISMLSEIDIIEKLEAQPLDEKRQNKIISLVKQFVFRSAGEQSFVHYGKKQRYNLAGFVEYINSKGQHCRFWLGLGNIPMVTLTPSNQSWRITNTWAGVKPVSGATDLGSRNAPAVHFQEQVVESQSGAGLLVDVQENELIYILTEGIYFNFPIGIETTKLENGATLARFNIQDPAIPYLLAMHEAKMPGRDSKQFDLSQNIESQFAEKAKNLSRENLRLHDGWKRYASIFMSLKNLLELPANLISIDKPEEFAEKLEGSRRLVSQISTFLSEVKEFPSFFESTQDYFEEQKINVNPILEIAGHSFYQPFIQILKDYLFTKNDKVKNLQRLKSFIEKGMKPTETTLKDELLQRLNRYHSLCQENLAMLSDREIDDNALCGYALSLSSQQREKLLKEKEVLDAVISIPSPQISFIISEQQRKANSKQLATFIENIKKGDASDLKIISNNLNFKQLCLYEHLKIHQAMRKLITLYLHQDIIREIAECRKIIKGFFAVYNLAQQNIAHLENKEIVIVKACVNNLASNLRLIINEIKSGGEQAKEEIRNEFLADECVFSEWETVQIRLSLLYSKTTQESITRATLENPAIIDWSEQINALKAHLRSKCP